MRAFILAKGGVYEKIISALVVDSSGAKRGVCPLCFGTLWHTSLCKIP